MKNYIIIDKTELEERFKNPRDTTTPSQDFRSGYQQALVDILSSGKDLQPVLEGAFDKGHERGYSGYPNTENHTKHTKQEYINNFKL